MPGIGEIELVLGLFQNADHIGTIRQRLDEGREIAPAKRVGERFQIVERDFLIGKCYHQMIGQRLLQRGHFLRIQRARQIDAGDIGPRRSAGGPHTQSLARVDCSHGFLPWGTIAPIGGRGILRANHSAAETAWKRQPTQA